MTTFEQGANYTLANGSAKSRTVTGNVAVQERNVDYRFSNYKHSPNCRLQSRFLKKYDLLADGRGINKREPNFQRDDEILFHSLPETSCVSLTNFTGTRQKNQIDTQCPSPHQSTNGRGSLVKLRDDIDDALLEQIEELTNSERKANPKIRRGVCFSEANRRNCGSLGKRQSRLSSIAEQSKDRKENISGARCSRYQTMPKKTRQRLFGGDVDMSPNGSLDSRREEKRDDWRPSGSDSVENTNNDEGGNSDTSDDTGECITWCESGWNLRRGSFGSDIMFIAHIAQQLIDQEINMDGQRNSNRSKLLLKEKLDPVFDNSGRISNYEKLLVGTSSCTDHLAAIDPYREPLGIINKQNLSLFARDGIGDKTYRSDSGVESTVGGICLLLISIVFVMMILLFVGISVGVAISHPNIIVAEQISATIVNLPQPIDFSSPASLESVHLSGCSRFYYLRLNVEYFSSISFPLTIDNLYISTYQSIEGLRQKNVKSNITVDHIVHTGRTTIFDKLLCHWTESNQTTNVQLRNQSGRRLDIHNKSHYGVIANDTEDHRGTTKGNSESNQDAKEEGLEKFRNLEENDNSPKLYFISAYVARSLGRLVLGQNVVELEVPLCLSEQSWRRFEASCKADSEVSLVFEFHGYRGVAWIIQLPLSGWISGTTRVKCP